MLEEALKLCQELVTQFLPQHKLPNPKLSVDGQKDENLSKNMEKLTMSPNSINTECTDTAKISYFKDKYKETLKGKKIKILDGAQSGQYATFKSE